MSRDREQRAAEYEDLAADATRLASQVSSTNPAEAAACVTDYTESAERYAGMARALRTPNP
ncbi:hypothetical protein SSOG_09100 [Streptomyces himastatinicus ATCC 53653]|uniref:Uncharacterized protein n=1 Tax=Streptomyces himastatinicus ATCC 53653 TaxID=457427 RepID=D9WWV8_9ACTN|nr:hypothetical protein [Streptomyces himastatinicus]EFL29386.1 hypothetical protein SSOG_09100 [Streptomyces himastatinicus ATCC 53653]